MKKVFLFAGIGFGLIVLVVGVAFLFARQPAESKPIPSVGGTPQISTGSGTTQLATTAGTIPYYLQHDPKWGSQTIGGSQESMAAVGCTITCVAMGLSALGHPVDPSQVCDQLKNRNGFTERGYLIWSKVGEITNGKIQIGIPEVSHAVIDGELTKRRPVIVKILLAPTIPHWVLIVGKEGQEYLAMDPLNDDKRLVKLSELSDSIEAVRVFRQL